MTPLKTKLTTLFLILFVSVFSQDLPPIVKYAPTSYGAGNQNWMISQDQNQFLFFANNEGLLEFNGSYWKLYPSPNETIIRSVKVIGDRVYTGSYMEFGFWKRKSDGLLKYQSLSAAIKSNILDDEQFWNILSYDYWVVFQSLNRIYIYNTLDNSFKIIAPSRGVVKAFKTGNAIYYQSGNQGLFEIEGGKSKLVSADPDLRENRIVNVFETGDDLLILTQRAGFYLLSQKELKKYPTEIDANFLDESTYSCESLSNGGFAIGTVSNGVFIITKEGKISYFSKERIE